ncbi:MAG: hypothetical protein LBF75_07455 [Treponema sp.]|nr:hypothetical protein [Treponema sp.]
MRPVERPPRIGTTFSKGLQQEQTLECTHRNKTSQTGVAPVTLVGDGSYPCGSPIRMVE